MDPWFTSHYRDAAGAVRNILAAHVRLPTSRVLDFGCGDGITALGVCREPVGAVVGVDKNDSFKHLLPRAAPELRIEALPGNLAFVRIASDYRFPFADGAFDAAYTWSVFEHIRDVPAALRELGRVLKPGGVCLVQIDPLYYSPFGSHLRRLVPVPWAHLLLSTAAFTELAARAEDSADNPEKGDLLYTMNSFAAYKEHLVREFLDLNRLTVRQLLLFARGTGFAVVQVLPVRIPGELAPPPVLRLVHHLDDLTTSAVFLVLGKGRADRA